MRREQVHRLICLRCWCLSGALPFRPEAPPPWSGQDKQRLLRPACPPGLTPAFALLRPEPPSPCSREGNHFRVPPPPSRKALPAPGEAREGAAFVSNRLDGQQCPVDVAAAGLLRRHGLWQPGLAGRWR